MAPAPIVLVPGFWLGAWAWDEVRDLLRADGHDVVAVTLPGLVSADDDPGSVTFADHVDAIVDAVEAAGAPVVLAVHSGAGAPGYVASDRVPDRIAAMAYVDTGPAKGPINPGFEGDAWELPGWDELGENLDGLTEEHLARFRARAVPQPADAIRGFAPLRDERRLDIPSTVICTGFPSSAVQQAVADGLPWVSGIAELRDVTWLDLPTSHWPMWSRPRELAELLGDLAAQVG